jgi:MFS family permease
MATVQSATAMAPTQPTRFKISRLLWLLSIFAFILNFEDSAVYAVSPLIQQEFHLSDLQISFIPAIEAFGVLLTAFPLALLADRRSRSRIISWSLLLWGLFTAVSGLAVGLGTLLLARLCLGLSMSGYDPSAQSSLVDGYHPQQRSKALAVQNTAENVGLVIGVAGEGILTAFLSWRSVFFSVSALAFAAVLLAWLALRDPIRGFYDGQKAQTPASMTVRQALSTGVKEIRQEWRSIFGSVVQMVALFGRTVQQCAFLAISFFLPLFFVGYYGFDALTAAQMVVVFNGAGLFGAFFSGWVDRGLERRFNRGVHFVVAGGGIIGCGILFFASLAFTFFPVTLLCLALAGVGMGSTLPPLSTAIGDVNGANRRAFAYSAQIIPSWFISALMPIFVGAIADTLASLKVSLMIFAGLLVVAGVVLVCFRGKLTQEAQAFQAQSISAPQEEQN